MSRQVEDVPVLLPTMYLIKNINRMNLVCYQADPNMVDDNEWKIYPPQSMIQNVIQWVHMILGYTGVPE